ncbi:beta/gamma crystallin domain-containing protein [Nocardia sp. NPDC101769]|uniref:beta/gamma crystallin domain-containing protein n=1 Tax=Nocardia sp. NPDC101769 TaxID=3364333 RepID=UPI003821B150
MSASEVTFYTNVDYTGTSSTYDRGGAVQVGGEITDRYKSVRVGEAATVVAWRYTSQDGPQHQWTVDTPDITAVRGVTAFKVTARDIREIRVGLVDQTGQPRRCSLTVESQELGSRVTVGFREEALLGSMPADGSRVTLAVCLRDEDSGEYVATGALHLVWRDSDSSVRIDDATNCPPNLAPYVQPTNRLDFFFRG